MSLPTLLLSLTLVAAPEAPPPPPSEAGPEHLGTPAASAKAAPSWWFRGGRLTLSHETEYAPEAEATTLWRGTSTAPSAPGKLRDVALACDLDYGDRRFDDVAPFARDTMAYGDIAAIAGVEGKRRLVTVTTGPDDSNSVTFLVPLVSLDPGQALVIRTVDVDFQFDDAVETIRAVYQGRLPLRLKSALRQASGECRLVERSALEAALAPQLKAADELLALVAKDYKADALSTSPRTVGSWLRDPRQRALAAASLVGWDDPRVAARVAAITELEKRLEREFSAAFDELKAQALGSEWTPIADDQLEIRAAGLRCGAELRPYASAFGFPMQYPRDACALHLGLRNRTDRTLDLGRSLRSEPVEGLRALNRRGESRALHVDAVRVKGRLSHQSELRLSPGQEVELVVFPGSSEEVLLKGTDILVGLNHNATYSPKGATAIPLDGSVRLEVVDYHCADPAFDPLAKKAWVFDSRRPLCGLRAKVINEGEAVVGVRSLPKPRTVDAAGKGRDPEGVLVLAQEPTTPDGSHSLAAGASMEVLYLFHEGPKTAQELRLGVPRKPRPYFVEFPAR